MSSLQHSATPRNCFPVDNIQNNAEANSSEAKEHQLAEVPLQRIRFPERPTITQKASYC